MNEWWLLSSFIFLSFLALLMALYPLRKSKGVYYLLIPLLTGGISLGYWHWGSWSEWRDYLNHKETQKRVEAVLQTIKGPEELIARMKARLNENPASARGWYLLGRLYASQNHWSLARDAFLKAHQLDPEDEGATVNYGQSLWQVNNQQFNEQIRTLFKVLLQKNPDQADALSMLAMDAFASHDYQKAITYWQQILKLLPSQSEEAAIIRKAIAKAQQALQ